ncbi:MAG: ABC transporter substrate-binding protein, partial [Methanophagales archaeon]|nr:ABC transporter substrate-binding protein [Methanophagales archaeon]
VGKEKELTLKCPSLPLRNIPSEVVTIHKPVKRIVVMRLYETDVLRVLNAADKIVGIRQSIKNEEVYYPEISKLPSVGSWRKLDYEAILSLNPDSIIHWGEPGWKEKYEEKLPGVTPIVLGLGYPEYYAEAVIQLGYILNKRTEAEEYINWHEGYLNKIKSRTEGLSEDDKPRVFNWAFFKPGEKYRTCKEDNIHQMCVVAGGKDIVDDIEASGCPTVDPEWVVEQNPDIIIALALAAYISDGYGTDDPSEMAAAREDILSRLELGDVNAVETGSVYMMNFNAVAGSGCLIGTAYMAKLFHPDLFEDLDPEAIHQEYMELQHFDFNVYEHGVFIYPPVED